MMSCVFPADSKKVLVCCGLFGTCRVNVPGDNISPPTLRKRKRAWGAVFGATGKQATFNSISVVPGCKVGVALAVGVMLGVKVILGVSVMVGVLLGVKVAVGSGVLLGVKVAVGSGVLDGVGVM